MDDEESVGSSASGGFLGWRRRAVACSDCVGCCLGVLVGAGLGGELVSFCVVCSHVEFPRIGLINDPRACR